MERIPDTVEFFPTSFPMSKLSVEDVAIHAAYLLIEEFKTPHPMSPINNLPIQQQQALSKLAEIFSTALSQHDTAVPRVKTSLKQQPNAPAPVTRVLPKNLPSKATKNI